MAIGVGNIVSASDYNNIYNKVRKVLGDDGADPQVGYGRALQSSAVSSGDVIDANLLDNLYNDLVKARTHQKGSSFTWDTPPDGINAPDAGEFIGAFAADVGATSSLDATADEDEGFLDFAQAADDIVADKNDFGSDQMSTQLADSATRTDPWNASITHTVDLVFANSDERRYFFNSGGRVSFEASLTGGNTVAGDQTQTYPDTPAYEKDEIWQTMLNNMETIYMGSNSTSNPGGTGTTSAIGNYQLTSNYQTIFQKDGSGIYSENFYRIEARLEDGIGSGGLPVTGNKIRFRITFSDEDVGDDRGGAGSTPVDENVGGTINSTVRTRAATGILNIDHPGVVQVSNLSGGALASSYVLTADNLFVTEGGSTSITLNTTGLANGTSVPYTITGIQAADLITGSITGSFNISNNTATLNFVLDDDGQVENETMTLSLDNGKSSISITIVDTGSPTYTLSAPNSVTEGQSLTITLNTQNVTPGTFNYTITGIQSADINNASLTGSVTTSGSFANASGDIVLQTSADGATENETLTLALDNGQVSVDVILNDPASPTYTVTNPPTNVIQEGSTGTFTVTTTNVAGGTVLYWTIDHLTTNDADFGNLVSGTVTLDANGSGTIDITPSADLTTEGQETFILRLRTGSIAGPIVASGGSGTTVGDASTDQIQLSSGEVYRRSSTTDDGFTVNATITFNPDGTITSNGNFDNGNQFTDTVWGSSGSTFNGSDYQIRATFQGGFANNIGGPVGQWLDLDSAVTFGRTDGTQENPGSARSTSLNIEIREKSTQVVKTGPVLITLTANYIFPTTTVDSWPLAPLGGNNPPWGINAYMQSTVSFNYTAQSFASLTITNDSSNNRVQIQGYTGDNGATATVNTGYINYTGYTNPTIRVRYFENIQVVQSEGDTDSYTPATAPGNNSSVSGTWYTLASSSGRQFYWQANELRYTTSPQGQGGAQGTSIAIVRANSVYFEVEISQTGYPTEIITSPTKTVELSADLYNAAPN